MSTDLFEVFTDVEVLKSREPEYFQCQEVVNIGNESDMYPSSLPAAVPPQPNGSASGCQESATSRMQIPPTIAGKTFVGVLEEGCRKYYDGTTPTYSCVDCDKLDWFAIKCELRKLSGVGSAKTKKSAKQLAAKEVLLKLINEDLYAEFGLGENKLEAISYLNKLMPELSAPEEETDSNLSENWIGKINEKCQKLKLRGAVYDVKDEGVAPQHLFVATCSVCKLTTTGQGRTKKAAKMDAAHEMFKRLEETNEWTSEEKDALASEIRENTENRNREIAGEESANNSSKLENSTAETVTVIRETQCEASNGNEKETELVNANDTSSSDSKEDMQEDEFAGELAVMKLVREAQMDCKDAESKLQDLLNADDELVKEVFAKQQLNFTIFSEADVNGDIQCMLKVLGANDEPNVFGGNGQNEQLSRDCAAREAFEFLYVFMKSNLEKRQLEEKKKQDGQEK